MHFFFHCIDSVVMSEDMEVPFGMSEEELNLPITENYEQAAYMNMWYGDDPWGKDFIAHANETKTWDEGYNLSKPYIGFGTDEHMEPNSPLDTASSSNQSLSHSSSSDNQVFVRLSAHQKQHWTTTPRARLSDTSVSSISTNDTEPEFNAARDDISTHDTESESQRRDDEDEISSMSSDLVDSGAEKQEDISYGAESKCQFHINLWV